MNGLILKVLGSTLCFGWLLMAAAMGAEKPITTGSPSPQSTATNAVKVLQVGDGIKLHFGGASVVESKSDIEQVVKEDGTISLEYIGSIKAEGLTTSQLELVIQTNYVPRYFKRLSVTAVVGNRFYFVGGQVRKPDRFPYLAELTVTKAIDSAGGFTEFGKKSKVRIIRQGTKVVETVDCEAALKEPKLDLPVYPGDRIEVPRRWP